MQQLFFTGVLQPPEIQKCLPLCSFSNFFLAISTDKNYYLEYILKALICPSSFLPKAEFNFESCCTTHHDLIRYEVLCTLLVGVLTTYYGVSKLFALGTPILGSLILTHWNQGLGQGIIKVSGLNFESFSIMLPIM